MYGINSERRIEQEIQVNMAYRWFLKLDIKDKVPHHSTISQNRRRRFQGKDLFRKLFQQIVLQCIQQGFVDGKLIFTDSTHIKANASRKSEYIHTIEIFSNEYLEELDVYETQERARLELLGKIKPEGMCYLSHQTIDSKSGIIIDVEATAGNVTDATPYIERIDSIENQLGLKIEAACADSGYDINLIHQPLMERKIDFFTPKRKIQKRGSSDFQRTDFIYHAEKDSFLCPNAQSLSLHRLNRTPNSVTREYQCSQKECLNCSLKQKCITEKSPMKRIQVNIFEEVVNKNHEKDGSLEHTKVFD